MAERTTRRVYSAEEMHRLRGTCSQPKLCEAIEENDGREAELVKEHVLRGSRSWAARSWKSRAATDSLHVPTNRENRSASDSNHSRQSSRNHAQIPGPVLCEIVPNGQIMRPGPSRFRPSPTPSLKRKKAEAIVKAHGSPQHVRVTAGGRIVPSELSPLCHPRYGYSAIKANGGLIKFAPNHPQGKAQWTQATQDGFVAQDTEGRLCQIVDGTILPLTEVDGALRLYMPAPNLNISSRGSSSGPTAPNVSAPPHNVQEAQSKNVISSTPPISTQTNALELEYSKLELELKELDKTEALHGRTMAKTAKEALVSKRRELVVNLDKIRKAIKSIKSMPPQDAPKSPRAMLKRESMSPPRNRLPTFLQYSAQEMPVVPMHAAYAPYLAAGPPQLSFNAASSAPSIDTIFGAHQYGILPETLMQPLPYDNLAVSTDPTLNRQASTASSNVYLQTAVADPVEFRVLEAPLPQHDGTRSQADLQNVSPSRQYHGIDIKIPETKPSTTLKSNLNPMSPAYKPIGRLQQQQRPDSDRPPSRSVKDRVPTPLSPPHQSRPTVALPRAGLHAMTDDTVNPTKESPRLHSSSVSSFQTADFFPKNTREYSIQKLTDYDAKEDRENVSPQQSLQSPETHQGHDYGLPEYQAPRPPPGTPVAYDAAFERSRQPTGLSGGLMDKTQASYQTESMPDRHADNVSPKSRRRDWVFVQEEPGRLSTQPSSSTGRPYSTRHDSRRVKGPEEQINFSEASSDWLRGYRAGLACKTVGAEQHSDFLDGYCAGLLKSKSSKVGSSTGSPVKSAASRFSPVSHSSQSSGAVKREQKDAKLARPPLESSTHSLDSLKQAVLAPHNENAVLTPGPGAPHVDETSFNLGAWAKKHRQGPPNRKDMIDAQENHMRSGFPFPGRQPPTEKRRDLMSETHPAPAELHGSECRRSMSSDGTTSKDRSPPKVFNDRVISMASIDSNLYRPWSIHRVFSSHSDWKSTTSVAEAAGLAAGLFANIQFDGSTQALSQRMDTAANNAQVHNGAVTMQTHSRFRERSIDGMSDATNPMSSPPLSPSIPAKGLSPSNRSKQDGFSPPKPGSPARAKFEHIAGRVGIKVNSKKEETSVASGGSPASPQSKRRWRDVWRGAASAASRKDLTGVCKEDPA